MTTITFDTHAFVKRLVAACMPEAQAEAVTNVVKEARETDLDSLATKVDLQLLEQRMTIKLGGLIVVVTGVILAAIKFVGH